MIVVRFRFANYIYNRRDLVVENGEGKSARGTLIVSVRGFRL